MKIYNKPGVVDEYTPTGDGSSAQTLKKFDNLLAVATSSGLLATTFTSDTEQTKDGSSRAMLKIQTRIPRAVLDHTVGQTTNNSVPQFKRDLTPGVHIVFSGYPELVRLATGHLPVGATSLDATQIGQLIAWQVRSLVAVCFGKSLPSDWETLPLDGSVLRGLLGIEPVDVVNGAYGSATV